MNLSIRSIGYQQRIKTERASQFFLGLNFKIFFMYVPNQFKMQDRQETVDFMRRFSFGLMITVNNNEPQGIHLPFVINEVNGSILLSSHCARANPNWKDIDERKILVVFNEPHAYISPKHYEKELNVPTWNYLAVHAYGSGRIIQEDANALCLLESMIDSYDAGYKTQWEKLPMDYKLKMIKGIVAFEIEVTELIGKKKLSQNKTEKERNNIISAFEGSVSENERLIAGYMKQA